MRTILNLIAEDAIAAGLSGTAQASKPPRAKDADVTLQTGADGHNTSEVFTISVKSDRPKRPDAGVPVRLVRNVATPRGPHDRVCIKGEGDIYAIPVVAIAPAGSGPNAALLRGDRSVIAKVQCMLLPAADQYRAWSLSSRNLEMTANVPHWAAPAIFSQLEDMGDQGQPIAIGRKIKAISDPLNLDSVCVKVSVLRAVFSAPDNVLKQTRMAEQKGALSDALGRVSSGSLKSVVDTLVSQTDPDRLNPIHFASSNQNTDDNEAFAVPFRYGFSHLKISSSIAGRSSWTGRLAGLCKVHSNVVAAIRLNCRCRGAAPLRNTMFI